MLLSFKAQQKKYLMLKVLNITTLILVFILNTTMAQNGWFVVTPQGDRLAWVEADELIPAGDLIKIKKNGKYGLIDQNGNVKIKAKYKDIKGYSNGLACVKASNGKYGFTTEKGFFPIEAIYNDATNFSAEGIAAVSNRGEWGYIDRLGKLLIDYTYADASPFKNGHSIVRRTMSKTVGMIDSRGRLVVPSDKYLQLYFPKDNMIAARKQGSGKWGFVNTNGKLAIEAQYSKVTSFGDGHALAKTDTRYAVINKQGREVAPAMFEDAKVEGFNDGLAAAMYDSKWGFINTKGEVVVDFQFEDVQSFSYGKAAVMMDGYWGYIDTSGELIIFPEFEKAGAFYNMNGRLLAIAKEGDMPPPIEDDGEVGFMEDEAEIVDEVNENWQEELEEQEEEEEAYEEEEMYEEEEGVAELEESPKPEWNEEEEEDEKSEEPQKERPTIFKPSGKPGKGKRPGKGRNKDKGKKPTTTASSSGHSSSGDTRAELKFVKALHDIEECINDSRLAYTSSLLYINEGHESGDIATFSRNAKSARSDMNKALDAMEKSARALDKLAKNPPMNCLGMNKLFKTAMPDIMSARKSLQAASEHLDEAFSRVSHKSMGNSLERTSSKLNDTESTLTELHDLVERCLTE